MSQILNDYEHMERVGEAATDTGDEFAARDAARERYNASIVDDKPWLVQLVETLAKYDGDGGGVALRKQMFRMLASMTRRNNGGDLATFNSECAELLVKLEPILTALLEPVRECGDAVREAKTVAGLD